MHLKLWMQIIVKAISQKDNKSGLSIQILKVIYIHMEHHNLLDQLIS